MKLLLKLLPYLSLILITIAIAVLSLLPPKNGPEIEHDKLGHLFAYFVLMSNILIVRPRGSRHSLLFISAMGYGVIMEILQQFIPGREPSLVDIIANSSGALLALLGNTILTYIREKI